MSLICDQLYIDNSCVWQVGYGQILSVVHMGADAKEEEILRVPNYTNWKRNRLMEGIYQGPGK